MNQDKTPINILLADDDEEIDLFLMMPSKS